MTQASADVVARPPGQCRVRRRARRARLCRCSDLHPLLAVAAASDRRLVAAHARAAGGTGRIGARRHRRRHRHRDRDDDGTTRRRIGATDADHDVDRSIEQLAPGQLSWCSTRAERWRSPCQLASRATSRSRSTSPISRCRPTRAGSPRDQPTYLTLTADNDATDVRVRVSRLSDGSVLVIGVSMHEALESGTTSGHDRADRRRDLLDRRSGARLGTGARRSAPAPRRGTNRARDRVRRRPRP